MADIPVSLKAKLKEIPDAPGVYLFKDASGAEVYVGKAKSLRRRVLQHFDLKRQEDPKSAGLREAAADVDYIECRSEVEAFLLENRLIKDLQPKFNVRLKSSATYPWVEVTWDEPFPRVIVTRDRTRKGSRFYGPFVSARDLRIALRLLQRVFKFRSCGQEIGREERERRRVRPCLEHYVGRCKAPCAGMVSSEEYRADVRRLVAFLTGRAGGMEKRMEEEMKAAARDLRFEEAARLRDAIRALESLRRRGSMSDPIEPRVLRIDPRAGLRQIGEILGFAKAPRVIEGVDIAHLHGGEAVGSLVQFVDGLPSKGGYRRYRIKTAAESDDFAAVREVVSRRYSRLAREGVPMPDLVLIDGGPGQLAAASGALREAGIEAPPMVSLSKKEEILHTPEHPDGVRLPRRSPGLRLLQHVRDEAHRFAQHYHHILRRKRLMGEDE